MTPQRVAALQSKLKEAQIAWDEVDDDRAKLEAQLKATKRSLTEADAARMDAEQQLAHEQIQRKEVEDELAQTQQECDGLKTMLAKVQRDANAMNDLMTAAESTFRGKYDKLTTVEVRVGRLEGLLSSMRELVELKQQATVGRLQSELDLRKRGEQEARDALEIAQDELRVARNEATRSQAALTTAEDNVRAAVAAQRAAEENAAKEISRWRGKAAKYRSRKMQAEEMLRMELQARASSGVNASADPRELQMSQARLSQMEMDKIRAEEALKAEREQWLMQEKELRASLDSLRTHSLQSDMARFRRDDPVGSRSSAHASELQLLSRKAVLLEQPSLARPPSASRSGSRKKR